MSVWWTHLQAFPAQLYLPLGSLTSTVAHLFCLILSCKTPKWANADPWHHQDLLVLCIPSRESAAAEGAFLLPWGAWVLQFFQRPGKGKRRFEPSLVSCDSAQEPWGTFRVNLEPRSERTERIACSSPVAIAVEKRILQWYFLMSSLPCSELLLWRWALEGHAGRMEKGNFE